MTCSIVSAAERLQRTEIPICQTVLASGVIRYFIKLSINDIAVHAMLDSGSVGLRVMPGVIQQESIHSATGATRYVFASGVCTHGRTVPAAVAFEGLAPAMVEVDKIEEIGCVPERPGCPAEKIKAADYHIFGEGQPGQGFRLIFGIGVRPAQIPNPLLALGAARWIVELPQVGSDQPGTLILNPDDEELRGFSLFTLAAQTVESPNGTLQGWRDVLPGALVEEESGRTVLGPVALDTGAGGIAIISSSEGDLAEWPQNTAARLDWIDDRESSIPTSFRVDAGPGTRIVADMPVGAQWEGIRAGILPYLHFRVLTDAKLGLIGLQPRAPQS